MFPRLFLARNLLSPEGAIFVSIDDHEVHNLRLLLDEVFGTENFVACVAPRVRDLLDSLYRGYPSGAILLWETDEAVPTREFAVAQQKNPYGTTKLLLDGQQRLTSLSAVLRGEPITVRGRKKPIELLFNLEHPDLLTFVTEVDEEADSDEEEDEATDDELQNRSRNAAASPSEQLPVLCPGLRRHGRVYVLMYIFYDYRGRGGATVKVAPPSRDTDCRNYRDSAPAEDSRAIGVVYRDAADDCQKQARAGRHAVHICSCNQSSSDQNAEA